MARFWEFNPVFAAESRARTRGLRLYVSRVALLLALLAGLATVWAPSGATFDRLDQVASLGRSVFIAVIAVQLATILLVAPAATAGAICVDKGRGTLVHLLVTDLSVKEIVAGKLAARLASILSLLLCGLPVLALCTLLGGFDLKAVAGAYLVLTGLALVSCALALTLSVWAKKVHQAVLPTYGILVVWSGFVFLLSYMFNSGFRSGWSGVLEFLVKSNPIAAALEPSMNPGTGLVGFWDQVAFFGVTSLVAVGLLGIAAWRIRPVILEQASRPALRRRPGLPARIVALLPGPPLDGNPVLWREWHRKRPGRWSGRFWTAYGACSALASAWVIAAYFLAPGPRYAQWAAEVNAWEVAIGLLLLSVTAATALAEERDRGSLDLIMTTTLTTREIVWGKWWGTFAMVPRLLIFPAWIACGLALVSDKPASVVWMIALILCYAAAITSLGLAFATWIPRMERAVSYTMLVYGLLTVGTFIAGGGFGIFNAGRSYDSTLLPLLLGNPYYGVRIMTESTGHLGDTLRANYWSGDLAIAWIGQKSWWPLLWIVIYTAIAAGLALATLRTFDRCLGRVSERPR